MFIIVKRSNLVILALSVFLSVATFRTVKDSDIMSVATVPVSDKVIIIDAGHGATDGGAVGISGIPEKELNLNIAIRIKELLEKTGAQVILTRADDEPLAESKREDMRLRKSIRDNSEADIFVSIHMNKFPQAQYSGAQVFYGADEESKKLGEAIQSSMKTILNEGNNRVAKKAEDSIYILKKTTVPSVIVECGFLSNPEEERLLNDKDYQEKVAWSVYSGIIDYFDKNGR